MTLNNFILPTDVLSTFIDEPSIITYVSTFFQHCSTTDEVNISSFFNAEVSFSNKLQLNESNL